MRNLPFGQSNERTGTITRVFIRDLQLLARIGIHGHEQGKPQPVRINADLETMRNKGADDLDATLDYGEVAAKIHAIVAAGHINLAETLAERIAAACLEDKRVLSVRIRVEKLHAMPGAQSAGVEIERRREV
jgi:dihydroneopterin aldolase